MERKIDLITDIRFLTGDPEQKELVLMLDGNPRKSFRARLLEVKEAEGGGDIVYFASAGRVGLARWADRLTEEDLS